ncbi:SAM-dependent methyltransferase [Spirillospora sp. NBC_00431]
MDADGRWQRAGTRVAQFIDVGTGIPTQPNPHQIARRYHPDAVVVGVDNDPVVLTHARALLGGMPIVAGDVRCPDELIADLDRTGAIDWARPAALLLFAVLHFVTDEQDPAGIVQALTGRIAPGSMVALSHVSSTGVSPETVAAVERVYRDKATAPGVLRTREQIAGLFGRLEVVEPGVVPVPHWPRRGSRKLTNLPILGGVGVAPGPLAERVVGRLQAHLRLVSGTEVPGEAGNE